MSMNMAINMSMLVLSVCVAAFAVALYRINAAIAAMHTMLDELHAMVNDIAETIALTTDFEDEEASPSPDDPFAHLHTPLVIQPDADGQRRKAP